MKHLLFSEIFNAKISEALINSEISHEEFMAIINEKKISIIKRKH